MDTSINPEGEKFGRIELADLFLSGQSLLTRRLLSKIEAGEISPSAKFTINLDLSEISNEQEIVRITRDIKTLVEHRELGDKIESIRVVLKRSQCVGEVINAISAFRSKCEIAQD